MKHLVVRSAGLFAFWALAASPLACGGDSSPSGRRGGAPGGGGTDGQDAGAAAGGGTGGGGGTGAGGSSSSGDISIEPTDPVVTVKDGKPEQLDFVATLGGKMLNPVWSIDRAEIGSIDGKSGHYETGIAGGEATITADAGEDFATTTLTVHVEGSQNGTDGSVTCDAGGCGGVGGEGEGPAVSDGQKKTLDGPATESAELSWLYPYDGTVWPLALLAPLLQWEGGSLGASAEAVKIELDSEFYSYEGYFGRPAALAAGTEFVRHPIPQAAWDSATQSSAGGELKMALTVLSGGKAYGPIEQTWVIAAGALKGTVYYQSYGTNLAHNYTGAIGGDGTFGGATLAITGSSTGPSLVAGTDGGEAQCRVCHSVSADGSRMIVAHGDNYDLASRYALTEPGYPETAYTPPIMVWAGLYPDGSLAVSALGPIGTSGGATALVDGATGAVVASTGLSDFVTSATTPMFSPDGTQLAFGFYAGSGNAASGAGDPSKLALLDFDVATSTFSNGRLVYEDAADGWPAWPAFTPTGDRLVFQIDLPSGKNRKEYIATRYGNRGELWWAELETGKVYPLDHANGKRAGASYLPVGPNGHDHDFELNFEPTISPIASGGYAWVVFTSRRMYGNVATVDETWSDPRDHDISKTPTTKKLWVAAIDLKPMGEVVAADPTDDPSHPAFYLPAQELLAGNARGFWVPEPCRMSGAECESGDQCCEGYCVFDAEANKSICGGKPPECSQEFDRCDESSDCCGTGGLLCLGGRCSRPGPQ